MSQRTPPPPRPCKACGIPNQSQLQLCMDHRPRVAKRPAVQCPDCGATTTAKSGICVPCRAGTCATVVDDQVALTGGRWRRQGLIHRWEPVNDSESAAA